MCKITINERPIHQSGDLYSLNDLFKASGSDNNNQPSNFIRLKQTQELIEEINRSSDVRNAFKTVRGGNSGGGTYAHKYLVYAYAMWISPKFHLHVIKAFDNQTIAQAEPKQIPTPKNQLGRVIKGVLDNDPTQQGMSTFPDEYIELLYKKINTATKNYKALAVQFESFKKTLEYTQNVFNDLDTWNEIITLNPTFSKAVKK